MEWAEGREPRRDAAQHRDAEMGVGGGDQCPAHKEAARGPETPSALCRPWAAEEPATRREHLGSGDKESH